MRRARLGCFTFTGIFAALVTTFVIVGYAVHKDKHNGKNGTDCAACHTPEGWGKKP